VDTLHLLKQGLQAAALNPSQLSNLKGSDPRKVAIARTIRQRTTVSMDWIAEKLSMRSAANVSQQIRRQPQTTKNLPKELQKWTTCHALSPAPSFPPIRLRGFSWRAVGSGDSGVSTILQRDNRHYPLR